MDTVTHGIVGALIGKAFFGGKSSPPAEGARRAGDAPEAPVAIIAATLGAMFPDIDVFPGLIMKNDLAILEWHRNITHSFVCVPIWAVPMAALTRWVARRLRWPCPSFGALTLIYAVALVSHVFLDLATSFGTMLWAPISYTRAAWDLLVIVDLTFTAIALVPQLAARAYEQPERSFGRALRYWAIFTALALAVHWLTRAVRFPFSRWWVVVVSAVFAAVFLLPAWRGWGLRVRRASWCLAGFGALLAYIGLCGFAHHAVLERTRSFATDRGLRVEAIGALPLPPSAAHWVGLILTPEGVYRAEYNLPGGPTEDVHFYADSAPNAFIERATRLRDAQVYLWFARFPVYRFSEHGEEKIVEISDLRFLSRAAAEAARRGRGGGTFTFRVIFDGAGRIVAHGLMREPR